MKVEDTFVIIEEVQGGAGFCETILSSQIFEFEVYKLYELWKCERLKFNHVRLHLTRLRLPAVLTIELSFCPVCHTLCDLRLSELGKRESLSCIEFNLSVKTPNDDANCECFWFRKLMSNDPFTNFIELVNHKWWLALADVMLWLRASDKPLNIVHALI